MRGHPFYRGVNAIAIAIELYGEALYSGGCSHVCSECWGIRAVQVIRTFFRDGKSIKYSGIYLRKILNISGTYL